MSDGAGPVYVVNFGASTPVGRDAWSTAAAVRAGISGFVEHPFIIDAVGEPIRMALAPWLDPNFAAPDRFEALLVPAIRAALDAIVADERISVALALGLPSPRPGLAPGLEGLIRAAVVRDFPETFTAVATFPQGHAAGLIALDVACASIAQGRFDACVVAGVDSYLDASTLEWLEQSDQLHGAGALNNAWGFVPGEGAGAVLVCGAAALERLRLQPLAAVRGVGQAVESNRIRTETVCIGEGLTAAFRQGLMTLADGERISDVFCDMNGEPYRADEFGFAALRTSERFVSASDFVAPADCWGDVGAASGPLCVTLAAIAGVKAYAKGRHALVWASSESGERAAAVIDIRRTS